MLFTHGGIAERVRVGELSVRKRDGGRLSRSSSWLLAVKWKDDLGRTVSCESIVQLTFLPLSCTIWKSLPQWHPYAIYASKHWNEHATNSGSVGQVARQIVGSFFSSRFGQLCCSEPTWWRESFSNRLNCCSFLRLQRILLLLCHFKIQIKNLSAY